jgi:hypothetical protein
MAASATRTPPAIKSFFPVIESPLTSCRPIQSSRRYSPMNRPNTDTTTAVDAT